MTAVEAEAQVAARVDADAPGSDVAAAAMAAGSRARGKRVFHPEGTAYTARIELAGGFGLPTGHHEGTARLSRGIGLPDALPDLLGLALRITDVGATGRHQDLLLVSSARPFPLRHLLVPAKRYRATTYSSLTRFRTPDGTKVTVEARPRGGDRQFDLCVATGTGPPVSVGVAVLDDPLPHDEGQSLTFDLWRHRALLEPLGWINRLRRTAYPASQDARPDA